MKLSKKLLHAVTIGVALGATGLITSCDSMKEEAEIDPRTLKCSDSCTSECMEYHGTYDPSNCPACGMG